MTIQFPRGTAAQNNSYTGPLGSLSYDTTNNRFRIHNGSTAGGFLLPTQGDLSNFATQSDLNDYAELSGGANANFSTIPQVNGDSIISSGTNGNGAWVRFSNGTQLCESFTLSIASVNSAVGSGYITQASDRITWTYPQSFIAAPVLSANYGVIDGVTASCVDFGASSTTIILQSFEARTGLSNNVKAMALGRWK